MRFGSTILMVALAVGQVCGEQTWSQVRGPVCGKILVKQNGHSKALKNRTIQVYKSRRKDVPCCEESELVRELKTSRSGSILIDKLDEGNYFLVVKDTDPLLTIPIWVPKAYEARSCDIDRRFTVDVATGRAEVTLIISVD
jgi:hypothetical protein